MFKGLLDTFVDLDDDAFRNIPSLVRSEDLLDDLSDEASDRIYGEAAVTLQQDDYGQESAVISRPFFYGIALGESGHGRPVSRFSDGSRFGVWYGSLDLETTIHETVYHFVQRVRDMLATIQEPVISERRVFMVRVAGILIDLRSKHEEFPALIDPQDYSFTHSVGDYLYSRGQSGLLVKSARCPGINVAAFNQRILSNARHHSYMAYRLEPNTGMVVIENPPNTRWGTISYQ